MSVSLSDIINADTLGDVEEEERIMNEMSEEQEELVPSPKAKKIKFVFDLDHTLLLEVTTVNPFTNQRTVV